MGTYFCYQVGSEKNQQYECKGYDPQDNLLLHTHHDGKTSAIMEMECWESRGHHARRNSLTPEELRKPDG